MNKKAFLCGVNRYVIPGSDLRGCVNDVQQMRQVLVELFEFAEEDISVVTDLDATKSNIESGLTDLVTGATPGDVLYFHFSGHGSNVPDDDGDEADERDEIFCPTDLNWQDPLRDDWVRTLLDPLPAGVNLTFVSDCCHSGSITRALAAPDATVRERYLPCPRDIWAVESNAELTGSVRGERRARESAAGPTDVKDVDLTEVLLTGCRADQTSADAYIEGDYFGALTHSLLASLRDTGGDITYGALHAQVLERLADRGFSQTPQLEGRADRFDAGFLTPFA
ncbi:MAG: caspase family protein [Acidimicrobiia bacterium]|nr:caspase family protein [Acidimicrobiia bacterium]